MNLHGVQHMKKGLIILVLCLLIGGCGSMPLLGNLLQSPTKTAASGVLFSDDFSQQSSGWETYSTALGAAGVRRGMFTITVDKRNTDLYSVPGELIKDAVVSVSAGKLDGEATANYGVLCRYQDNENFYAAQITTDGYAGIFKMENGAYGLIGREVYLPAPPVLGGSAQNLIQFRCEADQLILSVNGQVIDSQRDESFSSGDVGIIAGTYLEQGITIGFDDFSVRNISPAP